MRDSLFRRQTLIDDVEFKCREIADATEVRELDAAYEMPSKNGQE